MQLHIDSVLITFKRRRILNDVFLTCDQGEVIGVFGANGSGKSTLFKMVFGVINFGEKFVKIGDKKIQSLSDSYGRLKYMPQHTFLPSHVTIREIIEIFCEEGCINDIYRFKLVHDSKNKKASQLSGGERRIVELLLMLHSRCTHLLLDEPFSALDPIYISQMKEIIKECSHCKGILITDHNYKHVLEISTRLVLLKEGKLVHLESEQDLVELNYLSKI